MIKKVLFLGISVMVLCAFARTSEAHQPVVIHTSSEAQLGRLLPLDTARQIQDPTETSIAVYDSIENPSQVNLYSFVAQTATSVPVEALVPVRSLNVNFRPWIALISTNLDGNMTVSDSSLPFIVPSQYMVSVIPPLFADRPEFFEEYSQEQLFRGREEMVTLLPHQRYYIAVFSLDGFTGDYALGMGTAENFSDTKTMDLVKNVAAIKLGLVGQRPVPFSNFVSMFVMFLGAILSTGGALILLCMIALGYIRPWWTALSLRTQAFFGCLIFLGLLIQVAGAASVYRVVGFASLAPITALLQAITAAIAVYIYIVARDYRWVVVRYEKAREVVKMWKIKTVLSLIFTLLLSLYSFGLVLWYVLVLA